MERRPAHLFSLLPFFGVYIESVCKCVCARLLFSFYFGEVPFVGFVTRPKL